MKNVLNKNKWNAETVKVNMGPPLIPLIESRNEKKLGKDCVKIRLRRDATSQKSDLCKLKMAWFDNGDPEESFLFIRDFKMTLEASGTLLAGAKIQQLCMLVRG